jgi:hypothetical protein
MLAVGIVILTIVVIFCLGIGFAIYRACADFDKMTAPVTDISRYQEIRQMFVRFGIGDHFPAVIPSSARNVCLYHLPSSLRSGPVLHLQMNLLPEQVKQIQLHFRKTDKLRHYPSTISYGIREDDPRIIVVRINKYNIDLPILGHEPADAGNYEVMVLEDAGMGTQEYTSNHPRLAGMAIDTSTSTVIYWANYC